MPSLGVWWLFYFGVVLLWFPELPESVEGCLPSSVWEHSLLSLLTLLHSVFSPLGPSAHALDILTVPQCVFACPHAFSPSLSWILSITIFQSRALSRVVLTALHYSRILNLTLCIFSSSRFTGFFSTDFSVPQGLQPSSPTCPDDSPGCVCVCVCVCLCVALPSPLATWTQCQAACIREAHTQVHPHVPNACSSLAASKPIVHRCPSLGAPYLTSGWSPRQVHPGCESAPGHTMSQKDTPVILARPVEPVETSSPSWNHLRRGQSLSPGL